MKAAKSSTFLTDRFFSISALVQAVGVLAFLRIEFLFVYLGLTALFVALLIRDRWSLLAAGDARFDITIPPSLELGTTFGLKLYFHFDDRNARKSHIEVGFLSPACRTLTFGEKSHRIENSLAAGLHTTEVRLPAQAVQLGYEELSHLILYSRSRFQLWTRETRVESKATGHRVLPTRKPVPEERFVELIRGQKIFHQGTRRLMRGQTAEQFYTVRKFQPSDSLKHLDPKKSAKFQTPMTRTYESFYEHHLVIGLDLGRSLLGQLGNSSKKDYYLSAALALAESAIKARDKVSFFAFSQNVHRQIIHAKHYSDFYALYRGTQDLNALNLEPSYELIPGILQKCASTRSLFVLLTDATRPSVQQHLAKIVPFIARQHLMVIASLVDEQFSLPFTLDHFTGQQPTEAEFSAQLYNYYLHDQNESFKARLNQYGCGYVGASQSEWMNVIGRVYQRLRESTSL